jgi:hypothetical protein
MPKKVEAWKCDWCHRCFGRLCDANRHEKACNINPLRRNCKTCVHGILAIVGWDSDYQGDPVIERYGAYCGYHNKPMSEKPYYIDCEEGQDEYYGDSKMPGTCDHYEYKGKAEWTIEEVV